MVCTPRKVVKTTHFCQPLLLWSDFVFSNNIGGGVGWICHAGKTLHVILCQNIWYHLLLKKMNLIGMTPFMPFLIKLHRAKWIIWNLTYWDAIKKLPINGWLLQQKFVALSSLSNITLTYSNPISGLDVYLFSEAWSQQIEAISFCPQRQKNGQGHKSKL